MNLSSSTVSFLLTAFFVLIYIGSVFAARQNNSIYVILSVERFPDDINSNNLLQIKQIQHLKKIKEKSCITRKMPLYLYL